MSRFAFLNMKEAALAAFLAFALCLPAMTSAEAQFNHGTVKIETRNGPVTFDVEIADTETKRAQGLMFRQKLGPRQGMLFLFETDQPISMWMKNTYIRLDMVFIDKDWRISSIARDAEPFSMDVISSGGPASSVLEIPGGEAEKLGLRPGDAVIFQKS